MCGARAGIKRRRGHLNISKWCKSKKKENADHRHLTSLFIRLFNVDADEIAEINCGKEWGGKVEMNGDEIGPSRDLDIGSDSVSTETQ